MNHDLAAILRACILRNADLRALQEGPVQLGDRNPSVGRRIIPHLPGSRAIDVTPDGPLPCCRHAWLPAPPCTTANLPGPRIIVHVLPTTHHGWPGVDARNNFATCALSRHGHLRLATPRDKRRVLPCTQRWRLAAHRALHLRKCDDPNGGEVILQLLPLDRCREARHEQPRMVLGIWIGPYADLLTSQDRAVQMLQGKLSMLSCIVANLCLHAVIRKGAATRRRTHSHVDISNSTCLCAIVFQLLPLQRGWKPRNEELRIVLGGLVEHGGDRGTL
mmetsp:Transcript_116905/g.342339  ORF Transcript_116905/g.342339 Transcript_116905/m.342339 type:complete len:276 (-) Transcript_116905:477-1304(-)